MKKPHYFIRVGDAISQLLNALLFGGDPNHSISSDAYRKDRKVLRKFIDTLFSPFGKNHCFQAYHNDVQKAYRLIKQAETFAAHSTTQTSRDPLCPDS